MPKLNDFILSALLIYKMLTHKGECLQQREQILQKKKSHVFLFIHILLTVSQKRGSSILLHCVPQIRGSPSFPLAEFCCCRSKNRGMVRLRQRSTNLEPMRKVISLKHVKLRVHTQAAEHTATDNH